MIVALQVDGSYCLRLPLYLLLRECCQSLSEYESIADADIVYVICYVKEEEVPELREHCQCNRVTPPK